MDEVLGLDIESDEDDDDDDMETHEVFLHVCG